MYLFKDKEEVEIPYTCKLCLKEISFKITKKEYKDVSKFPIKKEFLHGPPEHNLIVYFNQYLEVENFEIKEMLKKEEVSYSKELTKQVLSEIDLSDDEIELYFRITGREAVSIGEMAILTGKPKAECQEMATKFVKKGLFKEIIGAKPHYSALPPYAALVSQLQKFHKYISDIKVNIPTQLEKSFAQLESESGKVEVKVERKPIPTELMKELKDNMLTQIKSQKKEFDDTLVVMDQIRGISDEISSLEGYTDSVMESPQIADLKKRFDDVNTKTSQIIKGQVSDLKNEFENIKSTVSQNLQKLRLGVISQTVEQVIDKVVNAKLKDISDNINVQLSVSQVAFSDELKKATQGVDSELISKLKESLKSTLENIDGITSKVEEDKEKVYADITENFNRAIKMAEEKIEGISGTTFQSLGNLKDVFYDQIVATLDNTLEDILNKLERSEKVTSEFWEQAKTGRSITMKDIWFIRSPEAAKAHISDEISKAKMRILLVAPQISDIDLNAIMERPSRINFRIAANIDFNNPEHAAVIQQLDKMDNVDYRHRSLQNLWGINRDYEEVIVCVLSKAEVRGESITEIAGIGSIIEEHIKIFVPILEESWMGARKEVMHAIKSSIVQETPPQKEHVKLKPIVQIPKVIAPPEKEVPVPTTTPSGEKSLLTKQFDLIFDNVDSLMGIELSSALEKFQSEYIKETGYNSVLKNIHNTSTTLKNKTYVLSQPEKEDLRMKMNFWRQKLDL
ncbi:MAG: hypothetical protein CEE42_00525 [Promethearchaeota archaeon Loki_b31]|nr:MAG: hypothetical protein CEE42_00525 [Candidatus Lokiarchaeota archaeon Loki_b31]